MQNSLRLFLVLGSVALSAGALAFGDEPGIYPLLDDAKVAATVNIDDAPIVAPVRFAPTVLHWLSTGADGLNLTMDKVKWDAANAQKGSGTLHVSLGDWSAPSIPSVPFKYVTFDSNGHVTGGSYTSSKDHEWKDIFHSGLTVKVGSGTTATISATDGSISFQGPIKVQLPFNGPEIDASNSGLIVKKSGEFVASFKNAQVTFKVAGFSIDSSNASLDYHHIPNQPDTFLFKAIGADLHAPLPKAVTTTDYPLELTADVTIDNSDGKVSIENTHIKGASIDINLAKPLGFQLKVKNADLKMTKNVIDYFKMDADLVLPPSFSNTKTPPDDPDTDTTVTVGVHLDAQNKGLIARVTDKIDAYWHGFGVHIPGGNAILDLSDADGDASEMDLPPDGTSNRQQLPNKWQGLYLISGTFELPDGIKQQDGNSASLKDFAVTFQSTYIDEHGFNGIIDQTGDLAVSIQGFGTTIHKTHLKIIADDIHECDIKGSLALDGWDGQIDLQVGISHAGLVSVDASTTAPISIHKFADFTLENGSIVVDPDLGISKLLVSGVIKMDSSLPKVGDMALTIKDVGIDSAGHFALKEAWLELPDHPRIDVGPLGIEVGKIGFGLDGQKKFWIDLTGDVSLSGDLPLQLQGNFDGLHISQDGTVKIRNIAVDCEWADLFHLEGEFADGPPMRPKKPAAGMPVNFNDLEPITPWPNAKDGNPFQCISGSFVLGLEAFDGVGINARFVLGKNCWFGMLGLDLPSPIPFGQSGFGLFGLFGGVGRNVKPDHDGATGIPTVDYQLIPDIDAAELRTQSSYIFTAGARLGVVAPPPPATPVWGDIALTIRIPDVNVDISGNIYLADKMVDQIPADPAKMNRVLHGDLNYDKKSSTFSAALTADLFFPTRDKWVFYADGGLNILISPTTRHMYLGGPIHKGPPVSIDNAIGLHIKSPSDHMKIDPIQGAVTMDFDQGQNPAVKIQAALLAGLSLDMSGTVDVGISVKYTAKGSVNLVGYLDLNIGNNGDFSNIDGSGTFHAHIDADVEASHHFRFIGDQGIKVKVSADADLAAEFATNPNIYVKASGDVDMKIDMSLGPISFSLPLKESITQEWKV